MAVRLSPRSMAMVPALRSRARTLASQPPPATMHAVVLDGPGPASDLKLVDNWPVPYVSQPLPADYVRVKVDACAVAQRDIIDRNGSDLSSVQIFPQLSNVLTKQT